MLNQLVEVLGWELILDKLTNGPRIILKLKIDKIEEGNLANLMLFNPKEKWSYDLASNASKSQNSPLLGQTLIGKVKAVFNNGKQVFFNC